MQATFNAENAKGFNRNHRKENHFQMEYSIMTADEKGTISKKLSCRIYGTQAQNYACVWLSGNGDMLSGSGSAGGYGYHRTSAAVKEALKAAGFTLDKDIAGVGTEAIKEALLAVATAQGWNNPQLFEAHP